MIIANSSPYLLLTPHSVLLRLFCSIAAPLFIFLSGLSFYISFCNKVNYVHKIYRAFYLLISAVVVDVFIWQIVPFQTFDVLYLISFGILINVLIFRFNYKIKLVLVVIFLFGSFIIQNKVGYRMINNDPLIGNFAWHNINLFFFFEFKRFLIDGWFPVFPWVGVAILGQVVAEKLDFFHRNIGIIKFASIILAFLFSLLVVLYDSNIIERDGYLELFYPSSISFIFFELFAIFFLVAQFFKLEISDNSKFSFLKIMGRKSLLIYIYHAFIISFVFDKYFIPLQSIFFMVIIFIFLVSCFLVGYLADILEKKYMLTWMPKAVKTILGII